MLNCVDRPPINAGRLIARKIVRRTVVTAEDARSWRHNLPKVQRRQVSEARQ
jgi:hypothetical protein